MRRKWTEEDDKKLRSIYAELMPADVAYRMNRTIDSVQQRAHVLGLTRPPKPKDGLTLPNVKEIDTSDCRRLEFRSLRVVPHFRQAEIDGYRAHRSLVP